MKLVKKSANAKYAQFLCYNCSFSLEKSKKLEFKGIFFYQFFDYFLKMPRFKAFLGRVNA